MPYGDGRDLAIVVDQIGFADSAPGKEDLPRMRDLDGMSFRADFIFGHLIAPVLHA
jgi:hypothetical protein